MDIGLAHHEARLQTLNGTTCPPHQLPHGHMSPLFTDFMIYEGKVGRLFHSCPTDTMRNYALTCSIRDIAAVHPDDRTIQFTELGAYLFMAHSSQLPQIGILVKQPLEQGIAKGVIERTHGKASVKISVFGEFNKMFQVECMQATCRSLQINPEWQEVV
jgi:hypothetical protein